MTAFGTVGAVVVAILIASWPAIGRWRIKPRLEITLGETEPFVHDRGEGAPRQYLRMGVRNRGRRVAEQVRGYVTAWRYRISGVDETSAGPHWMETQVQPLAMHWVGQQHARKRASAPVADIPPQTRWLFDLHVFSPGYSRNGLFLDDDGEGVRLDAPTDVSDFQAEVVITASNAGAIRGVIGYRVGISGYSEVRLTKTPVTRAPAGRRAFAAWIRDRQANSP